MSEIKLTIYVRKVVKKLPERCMLRPCFDQIENHPALLAYNLLVKAMPDDGSYSDYQRGAILDLACKLCCDRPAIPTKTMIVFNNHVKRLMGIKEPEDEK